MEIWKDVVGFEGVYQVSNKGNIRVLNYKKTGIVKKLKQKLDSHGYPVIRLAKNGERKEYKLHRLIAIAFLNNDGNKPEVNHKDYNRTNNNLENLEWVTKHENLEHQFKRGMFGRSEGRKIRVSVASIKGGEVLYFDSLTEAARYIGVANCCVSYCVSGKMKSTKGYIVKGA